MYNDVVIMESTYGSNIKNTSKTREFDVEHLRVAIETVIERKGSIIMPCFSFSRTQEILTNIYNLFGKNERFETKVIVDSKLSCDISNAYSQILTGDKLKEWEEVSNWKNVVFVSEKEDSQYWVENKEPKIIISSSGFCTNGRVVCYLKKYFLKFLSKR